jgi:hypothetical protein
MRKATLSKNPFPQNKQRFIVEGMTNSANIITRDNITIEINTAERPDKTVIPIGRVNSGEFNITLDFADNDTRYEYINWFQRCIDRATTTSVSAISGQGGLTGVLQGDTTTAGLIIGIDPDYKKNAVIVYHRLFQEIGVLPVKLKLAGCFPKSLTAPDFDMDGEDMATLEMSISYDDAEIVQATAITTYIQDRF